MRLPPWAIEAIRNGVADVARKASDAETISRVRAQAAELLKEIPDNASRSIDAIVKAASDTARGALDQGLDSVSRWTKRDSDLLVHGINASGVLYADQGCGIPMTDAVIRTGVAAFRGDRVGRQLRSRIDESLATQLGMSGNAIAVANNFDAAVAACGALANKRAMVLHRSQAIRLPSGLPLPDALGDVEIRECGGVQKLEAGDFDGIEQSTVLLADDGQHPIEPIDFGNRDLITLAVAPVASITQIDPRLESAESLIHRGADLVVLQGGPLSGGPTCGILVGNRTLIESIRGDARWRFFAASDEIAAMTLAALSDTEPHPLSVLVATGEENLRSRAERMAIRMTADDAIESCQVTDQPSALVEGARWTFPSRQLRLRHKTMSPQQWSSELLKRSPAIITRAEQDELVVDLRWVAASADATISDAMVGDAAVGAAAVGDASDAVMPASAEGDGESDAG